MTYCIISFTWFANLTDCVSDPAERRPHSCPLQSRLLSRLLGDSAFGVLLSVA